MNNKIWQMRSTHLGTIGFRLSLAFLIFCFLIVFSTVISGIMIAFIAIVGFSLVIITLGLVLVTIPDYLTNLNNILNGTGSVSEFLLKILTALPFVAIAGCVASIVGIVFLSLNKTEKHWLKFALCIFGLVVSVIVMILGFAGTFVA